jgi:hypothetical protein
VSAVAAAPLLPLLDPPLLLPLLLLPLLLLPLDPPPLLPPLMTVLLPPELGPPAAEPPRPPPVVGDGPPLELPPPAGTGAPLLSEAPPPCEGADAELQPMRPKSAVVRSQEMRILAAPWDLQRAFTVPFGLSVGLLRRSAEWMRAKVGASDIWIRETRSANAAYSPNCVGLSAGIAYFNLGELHLRCSSAS